MMHRTKISQAVGSLEAQCLRHSSTIKALINLLKNVREDGGLVPAQSEALDRIVAQNDAVMTGQVDELYGLPAEDRVMLADTLEAFPFLFSDQVEKPNRLPFIINRLRTGAETQGA